MKHAQPPIDTVIIRFRRQLYYADQPVYQAEVRQSPLLLRGGPFRNDIEPELEQISELFANRIFAEHHYSETLADQDPDAEQVAEQLEELGTRLYELLPEALRESLPRLIQHVVDRGHTLRLIFEANAGEQADQLLSIPWEILYLKQQKTHLGLMPRTLIVRRLLETVRQAPVLVIAPFRIAHVIAEPVNAEPLSPKLKRAERGAIPPAAGVDNYTLVAHPGSVERLLECLRQQSYQIIHFLGHGKVHEQFSQQNYLLFANEDGNTQAVTGVQLRHMLRAAPGIQLIVLNACHSASVTAAAPIALQLVYNGIPYVIAMQGEVLQQAAAVFAHSFYGAVQEGVSIELAVAQARIAIAAEVPGAIDWSLPALYTSIGITEAPLLERTGGRIERWIGQPEGQRQLGSVSIGFGGIHLLIAVLLFLSNAAPPLPGLAPLAQFIGLIALLPPAFALIARVFGRLPIPVGQGWSLAAQAALFLRMASAAALGLGLPAFYIWFLLILLAGLNFWTILAPIAQIVLLIALFAPALLVSYQEALGHARGFLSNADITPPTMDWQELIVILAGYIMLCGPLALLWLIPGAIMPPLGNLAIGLLLTGLGYQLWKQSAG